MYEYEIRPLYKSTGKSGISFFANPEDDGFRAALYAIFEPLGYVSEFDGHYLYILPGPSLPHDGKVRIESDEWGVVWCIPEMWGDDQANRKWVSVVDELLRKSGSFRARLDSEDAA